MHKKNVVVLGGGTGTSMVLRALHPYDLNLSAIISVADDGGSSGELRKELGVLPPGDARQCVLALANINDDAKKLFGYRFTEGEFRGHNVGNIMIAAAEKSTGNFDTAIKCVGEIMQIRGEIVAVSLTSTTLGVLHGPNEERVVGEHNIDEIMRLEKPRTFFMEPVAVINPRANKLIEDADVIIIGPGSLATSLIPTLIINGVKEAIACSKGKIIYNVNLTQTPGQTDDYTVVDFIREIQSYLPRPIDVVTYNQNGEINLGEPTDTETKTLRGANLLSVKKLSPMPGDPIVRNTIIHDLEALANELIFCINKL